MQGRLTRPEHGRIQYFPMDGWETEFKEANRLAFTIMEWTLDNDPFDLNPILCSSDTHKIKSLCSEYDISIPITCDCFMDYPLWGSDLYDFNKGRFNLVLDACKRHSISLLVIPLADNSSIANSQQVVELKKLLLESFDLIKQSNLLIAFETDLNPLDTLSFLKIWILAFLVLIMI